MRVFEITTNRDVFYLNAVNAGHARQIAESRIQAGEVIKSVI
jgi:hypothetical protein